MVDGNGAHLLDVIANHTSVYSILPHKAKNLMPIANSYSNGFLNSKMSIKHIYIPGNNIINCIQEKIKLLILTQLCHMISKEKKHLHCINPTLMEIKMVLKMFLMEKKIKKKRNKYPLNSLNSKGNLLMMN